MTDATYRSLGQARCRTISKPLEIQINDTDSYLHDCRIETCRHLLKNQAHIDITNVSLILNQIM